jgi:hypothetical protein
MMRLVSAVFACLFLLAAVHVRAQPVIRKGEPFPAIVLPTMADGSPASITDFRGKKVVLHVFASW